MKSNLAWSVTVYHNIKTMEDIKQTIKLSREWQRLIKAVETIGYGPMEIIIVDGKPNMINIVTQKIKLDGPEDETDKFKKIMI